MQAAMWVVRCYVSQSLRQETARSHTLNQLHEKTLMLECHGQ